MDYGDLPCTPPLCSVPIRSYQWNSRKVHVQAQLPDAAVAMLLLVRGLGARTSQHTDFQFRSRSLQ